MSSNINHLTHKSLIMKTSQTSGTLQKLWVPRNFSQISRVSQSLLLAVMCVPSIFRKAKGLQERICSFICLFFSEITSSRHLTWSNIQISEKKFILREGTFFIGRGGSGYFESFLRKKLWPSHFPEWINA